MGVYVRKDSPFYWLLLERPGQKPLREKTAIPHAAHTTKVGKQNRQTADDLYTLRMGELARGRAELPLIDPKVRTFAAQADWYETHRLPKLRGATRDRWALKPLRAFFADTPLKDITAALVNEYETTRLAVKIGKAPHKGKDTRRTLSPNTVNREIAVLKLILKSAVPDYLKVSPLEKRKPLRVVKREKHILTPEDEAKLLDVLAPSDRALYIVAVDTLIRLSNVVHLKRTEDKGTHLALVDSKTGPYTVPLSDRARKALDSLPKRGPYFFPARRTADPRNTIRLMLKSACKRAGLTYGRLAGGVTWHHATRATGATRMLRAGIDPRTVQDIGHWEDFRTMQNYLEPDRSRGREAVNLIGARTPQSRAPEPRKNRQQRRA